MRRTCLVVLRASVGLALPLATGCPDDATPSETADDDGSTGAIDPTTSTDTGSTSIDPDTSTSNDPSLTTTTVDPDTSSSSGDPDTSGTTNVGPGCGNGELDDGEDCDGAFLDGEDCASEGFEAGTLTCLPDCTFDYSACTTTCGDDNIQGFEQCEGDDLDGQDCLTQGFDLGELVCAPDCMFDLSGCLNYVCGNDVAQGDEVCDGSDLLGQDCSSQGFASGALGCADDCTAFDTSGCVAAVCGNNQQEGFEVCDGTDTGVETCATQGFDSGTLGCDDDCGGYDTALCFVCGDGIINGTEECDGNALGGATCISEGLEGGVIDCANDCQFDLSACFGCGNGERDGLEECDGVDFGGTTCIGLGWEGGSPTCLVDCTVDEISCLGAHTFCTSPGLPIGPNAGQTQSTIPVAGLAGDVVDIDVLVNATHTRVSDLNVDVRHVGSNISVSLADDQCAAANDINATFDQDAAGIPDCVEPVAIQGNVLPLGNLDGYVEVDAVGAGNGTWELTIADELNAEGGNLAQWCVVITTGGQDGSLLTVRTNDQMLRALDPLTLEFTDIGQLGVGFDFGDVAWDEATGTLWMIDGWAQQSLYTVDITTGEATFVGVHGSDDLFGLEVDPNTGVLYATGLSSGFWSVDEDNGLANLIAATNLNGDGLLFDSLRQQYVAIAGGPGTVYTIDPSDGSTMQLSEEGFINDCGFAYEPVGDLYWAIDWSGDLFTYDPNDGYSRTLLLQGLGSHDGMTFVPGFFP